MARMGILFDGFKELAIAVDRMDPKALKPAVEKALNTTGEYVQEAVNEAAYPYAYKGLKGYATGDMYNALKKDNPVIWKSPFVAEVSVGFNLYEKGGFHSIFVMYGTPRIAKDQKLYNAIKGTRTQHAIAKIQNDILTEALYGIMNGG